MSINQLILSILITLFINQTLVITFLIITTIFFSIALFLGIKKSYELKKENERLEAINNNLEITEKESL